MKECALRAFHSNGHGDQSMKLSILFIVVWTFLALLFGIKAYTDFSYAGEPANFAGCLGLAMIQWLAWAGWYFPIARLSRFLFGHNNNWLRFFVGHAFAGIMVSVLMYVFGYLSFYLFVYLEWLPGLLLNQFVFLFNCLTYIAIVAVENAIYYFRQSTQLELHKSRLQAALTNAQLQTLKMNLRPHFLFNALNSVAMLIESDTNKAAHVTALLGDFLRATLELSDENEITLSQELELIQKYLRIEEIRFEDRISVKYEIEPETLAALVPHLVLQPIVENAMRHGFGNSTTHGELKIQTQHDDLQLTILVWDSGNGAPNSDYNERHGLASTRSRIEKAYGNDGSFGIAGTDSGGTRVKLVFPLKYGS